MPLPNLVTPLTLADFAGGRDKLLEDAREALPVDAPESERRDFLLGHTRTQGITGTTEWLTRQLDAQLNLFTMLCGDRPGDPRKADAWDDSFQREVVSFFTTHFLPGSVLLEWSACEAETLDWLNDECPDSLELMNNMESRRPLCVAAARKIVDTIYGMRSKPDDMFTLLGFTTPPKKARHRHASRNGTHFDPKFIDQLRASGYRNTQLSRIVRLNANAFTNAEKNNHGVFVPADGVEFLRDDIREKYETYERLLAALNDALERAAAQV